MAHDRENGEGGARGDAQADPTTNDAASKNVALEEHQLVARAPNQWLSRAIEQEIIPRLFVAHMGSSDRPVLPERGHVPEISQNDIDDLFDLVSRRRHEEALTHLLTLRNGGVALEHIYVDLLAPVARRFGDAWSDDTLTFTDVTEGLISLHGVVHALSRDSDGEPEAGKIKGRVLLTTLAEEQHTFGLLLLGDCFRRAGWDVWDDRLGKSGDPAEMAAKNQFDLVGLSLANSDLIGALKDQITRIRRMARGKPLIMVGGWMFAENPSLAMEIGADATAQHCGAAPEMAERLVGAANKS